MYLLADVGGTNSRLTVSIDGTSFPPAEKFPTPPNFTAARRLLAEKIARIKSNHKIEASVFGIPGVLDKDNGVLASSPNLKNWVGQPIVRELAQITQTTNYLFNDAALAGLGEAIHGAGRPYKIVAYLTISTGIGGARIVNKQIDAAAYNTEPGWQIIDLNHDHPLTLEDLIGGANINQRYGQPPELITDTAVWQQSAFFLACGLQNVIALWSPEVIILGGPLMNKIQIEPVRHYLQTHVRFIPSLPAILPAALGDDRALHGALAFLASAK